MKWFEVVEFDVASFYQQNKLNNQKCIGKWKLFHFVLYPIYMYETSIFFIEANLGKLKLLTKYYDKLWTRKLEVNHSTYEQHILEKFDLWILRISGIFCYFYFSVIFQLLFEFAFCFVDVVNAAAACKLTLWKQVIFHYIPYMLE